MDTQAQDELAAVQQALQEVQAEVSRPSPIAHFLVASKDAFKRRAEGDELSATCTGFCLYYLAQSDLLGRSGAAKAVWLSDFDSGQMVKKLGEAVVEKHDDGARSEADKTSSTAKYPNQYNSSLQVAGYLRTTRALGLELDPEAKATKACQRVIGFLLPMITENDGFVARIGSRDKPIPSTYLTFWAAAVLHEWKKSKVGTSDADVEKALNLVAAWSEQELTRTIACHHAGLISRFDVIDMIYSGLTALLLNDSRDTLDVMRHALHLLFTLYFKDGCFNPSSPVISDRENQSVLCPTAEALALVLSIAPAICTDRWRDLFAAFQWLRRHRSDNGWSPEGEGRHGTPTGFMTSSSFVFMGRLAAVLDDVLSDRAAKMLEVPPFTRQPKFERINYPGDLSTLLRTRIIEPIQNNNQADLAAYSMILYGPPGTAKTTIAQKLAQDLRWPFLALNQNVFLERGIESLDATANHIFRLVTFMKRVVVLFDEVEELIMARADAKAEKLSRLLTTSMLPRIHHLRDKQRIVFIFATNYLNAIDPAASRLGRFDIIRCVMPPEEDERKSMLDEILKDTLFDEIRSVFADQKVHRQTKNFTYLELKAVVHDAWNARYRDGKALTDDVIHAIVNKREERRAIGESIRKEFEDMARKVDRP